MILKMIPMLVIGALLVACGGNSGGRGNQGPDVSWLTPAQDALTFDESWAPQQILLEAGYADGSEKEVSESAQWFSNDDTVAAVSAGTVTPVGEGTATITGVYRGHTITIPVTVTVQLLGVQVSDDTVDFDETGGQAVLQLIAHYSDGSEQDVRQQASWASADDGIASVSQGTITPVSVGETLISAQYDQYETETEVSVVVTFSGGNGSEEAPYAITTAEQLNGLRFYPGAQYQNVYFELLGDIDLSDPAFIDDPSGWVPIGSTTTNAFYGHLDGNNFTLEGLTINRPDQNYQGLFGNLRGVVNDLNLSNVSVTGQTYIAGLAGYALGAIIEGVQVSGHLESVTPNTTGSHVGGVAGLASGSQILNSGSHATVSGVRHNIGGLVGRAAFGTQIESSYAQGDVTGGPEAINLGGLVGLLNSSTIRNSYATGDITGESSRVGGLVGVTGFTSSPPTNPQPSIEHSYAAGILNVTGSGPHGGLVGEFSVGAISDSFYLDGQFAENAARGTLIDTTQLGDITTFTGSGWDFPTVWTMSAEEGRPVLWWEAP